VPETAIASEEIRPAAGWWRRALTTLRLWRQVAESEMYGGMGTLRLLPFMARYAATGDDWSYVPHPVPPWAFGPGSAQDFRWYFQSETRVRVRSVNELCEWLQGCRYAGDPDVFVSDDFWQHPRTFEHLRLGDCEDHALWAWRKLREIGFPAWFVVGQVSWQHAGEVNKHAWVQFTRGEGEEVVLEAAAKLGAPMIRPAAEVRGEYRPHFAVEHGTFRTRVYGGFLRHVAWYRHVRRRREFYRRLQEGTG